MGLGWDHYFVEISESRASIFLNLDPPPEQVQQRLSHVLFVEVTLREPGEHGMTTDAEFAALKAAEDELERAVNETIKGCYVGRFTHDGTRTFLVYVEEPEAAASALEASLTRHGYDATTWSEVDATWSRYHDWLYPIPEELQTIQDRRLVDYIAQQGDPLTVPRDVDHWVFFKAPHARQRFAAQATDAGFKVRAQWDDSDSPDGRFVIQVWDHHPLDFDTVAGVVRTLHRLATAEDGIYDGWETRVLKG